MRVPAVVVAVPCFAGCVSGLRLAEAADPHLAICAAAGACLAFIAALACVADGHGPDVAVAVAIGAWLAGASLGISGADRAYFPPLLRWFDGCADADREAPMVLEGVLSEDGAPTAYGATITLETARVDSSACGGSVEAAGGVRLAIGGEAAGRRLGEWRGGRTVRVTALVRRPVAFRDPGVPDDVRLLARRGIVLVGSVKSAALVDVLRRGGLVAEAGGAARAWVRVQLSRFVGVWSERSAALSAAILIGDRSGLSAEDERRLQAAGTYHVLAISGGNIAIVTALLLWVMRLLRIPPRLAAAATMTLVAFYGEVTGLPASVSRAVAAAVIFLGGRLLDHRGPPLNALAVAAVGALAASPLAACDPGFLLSFGATLGILLGAPALLALLPAPARARIVPSLLRTVAGALTALLVATVCAEIALAPLTAGIFSRITFAGLVLNFAAIPLMTIEQLASMCVLLAAPVSPDLARAAGYVADRSATALVASARLVDVAPWLAIDVTPPSWWLSAIYYGAVLAALASRRWRRLLLPVAATAAALVVASPGWTAREAVPPPAPGVLRVVFLDVGQGDATLVALPDGRALLVDAGGLPGSSFDVGERVVTPALRALGVRRLEALVLTHGDPDHIGGALAVMGHFDPRAIWEGIPVPPHEGLRAIAAAAASARAWQRFAQAGDVERHAGVELRVLHPTPADWERQRVRNDDSIVVELGIGRVSIVLPGDIGREGERAVIPRLSPRQLMVLKAPHHGSLTSSSPEFLAAARPDAVIFSAGAGNHFGHPAPAVVDRYLRAGAAIFRTDRDGAVVLETDGQSVEIVTWSGLRTTLAAAGHEGHEGTKDTKK
jgi:competence protein ComEC